METTHDLRKFMVEEISYKGCNVDIAHCLMAGVIVKCNVSRVSHVKTPCCPHKQRWIVSYRSDFKFPYITIDGTTYKEATPIIQEEEKEYRLLNARDLAKKLLELRYVPFRNNWINEGLESFSNKLFSYAGEKIRKIDGVFVIDKMFVDPDFVREVTKKSQLRKP